MIRHAFAQSDVCVFTSECIRTPVLSRTGIFQTRQRQVYLIGMRIRAAGHRRESAAHTALEWVYPSTQEDARCIVD